MTRLAVVREPAIDARGSRAFASWMDRQGYAPTTIRNYGAQIRLAEKWLAERGFPALRHCRWEEYRELFESRPHTHTSRALFRNALMAYWNFLGRKPPGKLRVPVRPVMKSRALETSELRAVLKAAREMGPEMYAACCLGYYAALRRMEITRARWDWFDFEKGWIRMIGKGNKEAFLPISAPLKEALLALPRKRGVPWVFSSSRPKFGYRPETAPIADGTLNMWFHALRLATGIHVTPHVLRHSALTEAVDRTKNLRAAQGFARHSDPRTTAGYSALRTRRLLEVAEAVADAVTAD